MKIYSVLIVDDSAFMRKTISLLLEKDPAFQVVGVARNGVEALQKVEELKPDVITMDVEMPQMDGITCVKHIMEKFPTPILMLSSFTQEGSDSTVEALQSGAVDFYYKDRLLEDDRFEQELLQKLKFVSMTTLKPKSLSISRPIFMQPTPSKSHHVNLLIIGSSTGGPSALTNIITALPKDFPVPVLIVQHMPTGFTKSLAERFNGICQLPVKEVERGDRLQKGHVYIAPAGYQTTFQERDGDYFLNVSKDYSEDSLYKPSVDVSILSACEFFKEDLVVTILTGMGEDGKEGCETVRTQGGYIFAESEQTTVVYGMPKAVIDAGLADEIVPIHQMYDRIERIIF